MTSSGRALLIVVVVSGGLAAFLAGRFLADPVRPAPQAATPPPMAASIAAPVATPAPHAVAVPPPPAQAPTPPEAPRFDVVRVGARGVAVIAGRAAPGAEVVLMEDGRELARARADSRGEWVILPADPLRPGTRQFSLLARLGGAELPGTETVVVVVAEPAPLIAEAPRPGTDAARAAPAAARPAASRADAEAKAEAEAEAPARPDTQAATAAAGARPGPAEHAAHAAERALPPVPSQPLVLLLPAADAAPRLLQRPAAQAGLGLDQVDYDGSGGIRFAGTAQPGSTVRVYVDDAHAGDAQVDGQGRWALAPQARIEVGRHRLRVDQVASAGAVAARVEVPFQRDQLPEGSVAEGRVVVQPGSNLWRLARAAYGRGMQYTVIYQANREQIRNPSLIYPGQVFAVPGATPAASSLSR